MQKEDNTKNEAGEACMDCLCLRGLNFQKFMDLPDCINSSRDDRASESLYNKPLCYTFVKSLWDIQAVLWREYLALYLNKSLPRLLKKMMVIFSQITSDTLVFTCKFLNFCFCFNYCWCKEFFFLLPTSWLHKKSWNNLPMTLAYRSVQKSFVRNIFTSPQESTT